MAAEQQIFTFRQVQAACKRLLEEEADLIENDRLPPRTAMIADIFARMSFDDHQFIDRNLLSVEQAKLLDQYAVIA